MPEAEQPRTEQPRTDQPRTDQPRAWSGRSHGGSTAGNRGTALIAAGVRWGGRELGYLLVAFPAVRANPGQSDNYYQF